MSYSILGLLLRHGGVSKSHKVGFSLSSFVINQHMDIDGRIQVSKECALVFIDDFGEKPKFISCLRCYLDQFSFGGCFLTHKKRFN